LIANIVFNLNKPKGDDQEILASMVRLCGNMSVIIRKIQKKKFMVDTGTYNLV